MTQIPAGWYPDGSGATRWWDGTGWTEHVAAPVEQVAQPTVAAQPGAAAPAEHAAAASTAAPVDADAPASFMRRPWFAAAVAVVVLLAIAGGVFVAVSGSDDGAPAGSTAAATASASPVARVALNQTQLEQALLTVSEAPAGYAADTSAESTDDPSTTTTPTAGCEELTKLEDTPPGEVSADANFAKSPLGPFLFQGVASGPYEVEKSQFDALRSDLTTCTSYTEVQDGAPVQNTVTPLSMPKYGDDSLAFRLASTQQGTTFTVDFVIVMRGSTVLVLGAGGLTGAEPGVLEQITPKALTKLDAVLAGAGNRQA